MPSSATITSFFTFSPGTTIRSSQVNTNFSNFRGHLIPVDPTAASSPDVSYDLGSYGHHWRSVYAGASVYYGYATSSSVSNPTTGSMAFYSKSDGRFYSKNPSGTETDLFQYATDTLPGLLSTAASQLIGGEKKFANGIAGIIETSSTETGTAITITTPKFIKRLTGAITSIAGITAPSTSTEKIIILTNATGSDVTVINDATATAADRVITGSGANLTWANTSNLLLYYDTASTRWRIIGGSGSGGGSATETSLLSLTSGANITVTTSVLDQVFRVQGGSDAATLASIPFTGTITNLTTVTLIGNSDDYPVEIIYSDATNGCVGNFERVTLYKYQVAKFRKSDLFQRWVYVS